MAKKHAGEFRAKTMKSRAKSTFASIFLILAITLMLLPFLTTFSEALTRLFIQIRWYRVIQDYLVPFETRLIVVVAEALGQEAIASASTVSILKGGAWQKIVISWNCLGWQSILVLAVTLFTGLQGSYTRSSKFQCLAIGILGTFLVNILRISLVAIFIVFVPAIPATISHNYLSTFILVFWLLFFWWFSYRYVLEERNIPK